MVPEVSANALIITPLPFRRAAAALPFWTVATSVPASGLLADRRPASSILNSLTMLTLAQEASLTA